MKRTALVAVLLLLSACDPRGTTEEIRSDDHVAPPAHPGTAAPMVTWVSNPRDEVTVQAAGDLLIETGPHAILWPAGQDVLEPPYFVSASFTKEHGRFHEGYGIIFGGRGLDQVERLQSYSYFLVRGDGSFLIRRRDGNEIPVVRAWTAHPAIQPDVDGRGQPNVLRVEVGTAEVRFVINDVEVATVPAAALHAAGMPGIRLAHDVRLRVSEFAAGPED